MSKAYEMIAESLNEIIDDFEKNEGKNLNRETMKNEDFEQKISVKNYFSDDKNVYILQR